MSTPTRAGWYDDPQDDSQLRYFDGVVWTKNTTPRSTRPASVVPPREGQQQFPGQGHPPQYAGQTGQAQPPGQPQHPPAQGQQPGSAQGWQAPQPPPAPSPHSQFPGAPQPGQWNAPAYPGLSAQPTTPDGQPLASFWQRAGAFVLDWIIQTVIGALLGFYFLVQAFDGYFDEVSSTLDEIEGGGQPDLQALTDSIDAGPLLFFSIIAIAVFVAYQFFFLTRSGQTPGKMVTGISVRLRERPGAPSASVVARRLALPVALFVVQLLGLISIIGVLTRALDLLWPAWDPNKQALHDKIAQTNVVVGKQPRG